MIRKALIALAAFGLVACQDDTSTVDLKEVPYTSIWVEEGELVQQGGSALFRDFHAATGATNLKDAHDRWIYFVDTHGPIDGGFVDSPHMNLYGHGLKELNRVLKLVENYN